MSEAVLRPYRFGADALALSCVLEDVENETTPSGDLLLLEPLPRGGELRIAATVRVTAGTFERVLPEDERRAFPLQVAVVVRSPTSRVRTAFPLADVGDSFAGVITIPAVDLFYRVSLMPVLVRSVAASGRDGFGTHRGAILANGQSVDVLLDEPIAPPGGYLEIEFEDFSRSPNALRQRNADRMFAIDTEGPYPKLWLNQAINNLEAVMRSRARRGVPRRIRDATYDTICCQVWTALISASLTEIAASADDDVSEADAISALPEWQQRVLYFWAPRLYPELSNREQALSEVCSAAWREGHGTELLERASLAIQAWAGSSDAFVGLTRLLTGEPA
jgi:hypothetical protein